MVAAMGEQKSLKAYRNITLLLLLALVLNVRLVSYGEHSFPCAPGKCAAPPSTLMIFSHQDFPENGVRRALGLFAANDVPVWLGWSAGLILPVMLVLLAVYMLPKRPWQK
jgi:hypothetical protein